MKFPIKFQINWKWFKEHITIKAIFGSAPKVPMPIVITLPIPVLDGEVYILIRVKIQDWQDFFAIGIKF